MRYVFMILLFFFPASVSRFIAICFRCKRVKIGKRVHVGFSIVKCDEISLEENSTIGHFNLIDVDNLRLGGGKIRHFNIIKGPITFIINDGAWIHSFNKITCSSTKRYKQIMFIMKSHSVIIQRHLFDLTDSITIGEYTLFAGVGSQVWTHSFIMGNERHVRVDGEVVIGKKCYIGARTVICAGLHICDNAVIGANTTITKDITEPGLYVSQPVRKINYDADAIIRNLSNEVAKNVYSKTYSKA